MNNTNYSYSFEKNNDMYLVPIGKVIQVDGELENLIVRNEVKGCPLKSGDLILKAEDKSIRDFNHLSDIFYSSASNQLKVTVKRGDEIKNLICNKEPLKKVNFNNAISGFATLTYINPKTNAFGAVGHAINIGDAKQIPIKLGSISTTTNVEIQKSSRGNVGYINAHKDYLIGNFTENTQYGIKGTAKNIDFSNQKKYKVANLGEVELGKAQIILQNKQNKCVKYDIEILKIENQNYPQSKTFKIRILDEDLIKETGGIVQGMSGTPIIQNNKIIGAVSHALENNPKIGYGIYIKWML
ncbi:SpoIVB peptidase S55 domain-containing protein [Intestinibacter sp.]